MFGDGICTFPFFPKFKLETLWFSNRILSDGGS